MDLFRSWLYGHERPKRFSSEQNHVNEQISTSTSGQGGGKNKALEETQSRDESNVFNKEDPSELRKFILRFVPLEPGDCLGCKLVGTSVMVASGIVVLTSATVGRKRNPSLTGHKLVPYYIVCGSLFIGFEAAAVCRFFDIGPFGYLARQQAKDTR